MAGPTSIILLIILGAIVAVPIGVILVIYLLVPLFTAIGWVIRQAGRFVYGEVTDILRIVGAIITALVMVPLTIGSIILGRWSASAHYGRAIKHELVAGVKSFYRVVIGHPARLFCLTALTDGIENRIPQVVAHAPGSDAPGKLTGKFDGYRIIGSLPGGGSGGKLYVAEPDEIKRASFARQAARHGLPDPDVRQVVIKCFSLTDGSSLPQIIRESRALEAAKNIGLVLEHELTDQRFFYIMRYVPGESLALVTQRLHSLSGAAGLDGAQLREALGYASDLARTLQGYHRGGLWHKDVKPDNIIVDGRAAHLVDLGLITPLRSAMTLTTHGTEYFRDPEMVRMALKGAKVHQVDGAKFDIFAAGAVLFSVIEGSFPAHGGLSQITKRCPEALRWIVRRAMTDYDKRYATASDLLADIDFVRAASDPFAIKPVELPSMSGVPFTPPQPEPAAHDPSPIYAAAGSPPPPPEAPRPPRPAERPAEAPAQGRPRIRLANWWTGQYVVDGAPGAPAAAVAESAREAAERAARLASESVRAAMAGAGFGKAGAHIRPPAVPVMHRGHPMGLSASEQLKSARARAAAARDRARGRVTRRRPARDDFKAAPNAGVAVALFIFLGGCVFLTAVIVGGALFANRGGARLTIGPSTPMPPGLEGSVVVALPTGPTVVHASSEAPVPPEPPAADLDGLAALILRDPIALVPPVSDAVQGQITLLKSTGIDLYGVDDAGLTSEESAERTELAADLRLKLGLAPFQSAAAKDSLTEWLADHDRIDFVVWIGRDPERGEGASTWLVPAPGLDPEVLDLAAEVLAP
jgi:serine/threonine protein kinase